MPPTNGPAAGIGSDRVEAANALWWQTAPDGRVVCNLCPRGCSLAAGDRGFCFVRLNRDGRLVSTTYGRSTGFCIDPIEKKPLHQFYPGTSVLSFGTPGCNLGCRFCQNWTMSRSRDIETACETASPEAIAEAAVQLHCRSVAFTYNDPIVWAEYAIDTARACRTRGVKTVAVTSGYINPAAREAFFEHIDAANVDLKAFTDDFYRRLAAGRLEPVLDTLRWLARHSDVWLEITNLIIPGENDSPEEIERMCRWIVDELGPDVPLHFSAFHPDFKLTDHEPTPPAVLVAAYEIAQRAGLRYVYTGNVVDRLRQATYCPGCKTAVIVREGYELAEYRIREGRCQQCGGPIAGRFDPRPGTWGSRRQVVRMADFAGATAGLSSSAGRPKGDSRIFAANSPSSEPEVSSAAKIGTVPEPAKTMAVSDRPELTGQQQREVFEAAGRRVAAVVSSRTAPSATGRALGHIGDLPVYGAFVSLKRGGKLRSCCGFLGQNVPLREAVDHAAVRAAKDDPRFPPIAVAELPDLDMEVWLLWGLRPVAARGRDRLDAFVIGRHGLQVAQGNARGLLLPSVAIEHRLDAQGFLEQVCLKAGLAADAWLNDDTALMTFEGFAIRGPLASIGPIAAAGLSRPAVNPLEPYSVLVTTMGSQPADTQPAVKNDAPEVRRPAVAGAFYPAAPQEIRRALDGLFAEPPMVEPEPWPAAMVPHAGWVYSGRLAAQVLRRVKIPSQVIILAPKHRPDGADWAVAPYAGWGLPGGEVAADPALARQLAGAITGLELDAAAHRQEHAIEVQLPLLARLAPQTRVTGVTLGGGDWPHLQEMARQLAQILGPMRERPLLVVSSDLNHFADDAQTRRLDERVLAAIRSLDPRQVFEVVQREQISMCGMRPAVVVMETLRLLGSLSRCEVVGHMTSAEVSGETSRVVGYAGVLWG